MKNQNRLIGNKENSKEKYCLPKTGKLYLVYLGYAETTSLNLVKIEGTFTVMWFNPREGGKLQKGSVKEVEAGGKVEIGLPPKDAGMDWLAVVLKK